MGGAIVGLVVGFVLLIGGAELLVRGASKLAALLGLSSVVIGLTVVAFGTSTPELAVSIQAGLKGNADIAIGNVVGSNIFNILLILGIAAVIAPLTVAHRMIRLDIPLLIVVSVLFYALVFNGELGRLESAALVGLLIIWMAWLLIKSRNEPNPAEPTDTRPPDRSFKGIAFAVLFVAIGLVGLVYGGDMLVNSSVFIAKKFGVSERVIGLTLIAIGTSLPELATSIVAAMKREGDLAVANIVGSNMFNILGVLGIAGAVSPHGLAVDRPLIHLDLPVMLAATLMVLPIAFTGRRICRAEGILFLAYFLFYMVILFTIDRPSLLEHRVLLTVSLVAGTATMIGLGFSVFQSLKDRA